MLSFIEISFSEQAEDIERIPDAIPKPLFTAVSSLDNPTFVIIDLETTDLSKYFSETKIEKRIILKIITCTLTSIFQIIAVLLIFPLKVKSKKVSLNKNIDIDSNYC